MAMKNIDNLDILSEKKQGNKIEFSKFKQIAVGAIAVLSLTTVGVGGMYVWEGYQKAKVEEVENHIKQMEPTTLYSLIDREKESVQKTYLVNKALFSQYENYKDVLLALEMQNTDTKKIEKNNSLYKNSLQALDTDKAAIERLVQLTNPGTSFEAKKDAFLGGTEILALNKWESALKNHTSVYSNSLLSLNNETKQNLVFLEDTKKEIIQTVNQKIASKDYNLNATESALAAKVSGDLNNQISELEKVKRELSGTEQENLLTNSDLNEAKEAVNQLQSQAVAQISQDKAQVQSLLAAGPNAPVDNWDSSTISNGNNNNINANNSQRNQGWGFFEYFLLYNWLSGGNSNSPSAMASFNSSSHYNHIQSNLYNHASQRYNINDTNSYLNRSLSGDYQDNITSNLHSNKNTNKFNASTSSNLAKGFTQNNTLNKLGNPNNKLNALDKIKAFKAKKFDISAIKEKIQKIRTKAVTAKKEYKVAVERKAEAKRKEEVRKKEALAAKSSSSSISGTKKSTSSFGSFSSSSRSGSSSRRK
jgi:septal ring factor EnvC (AmiA/AmiB activator)